MSRLHLRRLQAELQDFERGEGPVGISILNASDLEWYPADLRRHSLLAGT